MRYKDVRKAFCNKISNELRLFKLEMCNLSPEEIYGSAYQIDITIQMYEFYAEKSEKLTIEVMTNLIMVTDLLSTTFNEWMLWDEDGCADNSLELFLEGYISNFVTDETATIYRRKVNWLEALGFI